MKLHERLRLVRNQRAKTLQQVSDATGLSLGFLSDLEHMKRGVKPSIDSLLLLASAYGLSPAELIYGLEEWGFDRRIEALVTAARSAAQAAAASESTPSVALERLRDAISELDFSR